MTYFTEDVSDILGYSFLFTPDSNIKPIQKHEIDQNIWSILQWAAGRSYTSKYSSEPRKIWKDKVGALGCVGGLGYTKPWSATNNAVIVTPVNEVALRLEIQDGGYRFVFVQILMSIYIFFDIIFIQ